uniref:Uncharacterized protein n=1 Tax=Myoviridae sp. ct1CM14 TaxID=2825018 RepID=A0A8S5NVS5_9CAUD|nr:MAG TPA: hypothetical protein [Myoviridae sp. ct1CM14]DAH09175.1 MAG TPA: hypothetical protein [Caudoviricetes sp.]DAQ23434.1 MAG TPA: hypothetical protein [Caudoviricetes sp.]
MFYSFSLFHIKYLLVFIRIPPLRMNCNRKSNQR